MIGTASLTRHWAKSGRWAWLFAGALSVAGLALTSAAPTSLRPKGHLPPLLPRKEVVSVLGAPFLHLITDYFWIQTIQAVGKANDRHEYRDIYDYAEMVTELDPRLRQVYVFAAVAIPFATREGEWLNTAESTKLLEKGLREFPDHLFLRILLAYNYSTFEKDYLKAARTLEEASRLPDAPAYLGPLAARFYGQAGKFDTGLALTQALAHEAEDPELREEFLRREQELLLERELQRIDDASARFHQLHGRYPSTIAELVNVGLLERMPSDPMGGVIMIDAEGRSRSSSQKKRLTVPQLSNGESSP